MKPNFDISNDYCNFKAKLSIGQNQGFPFSNLKPT